MKIQTAAVAITLNNGELAVMQFITQGRGNHLPIGAQWVTEDQWTREPSEDNIKSEVLKTFKGHVEQPVSWRIISNDMLPVDRTYRAAWVDVAGVIAHDMNKARDIHRDLIRRARVPKLATLDAAYMRATEEGSDIAKIVEAKNVLRDLPADSAIDAAQTIEQLKSFWPEDLI